MKELPFETTSRWEEPEVRAVWTKTAGMLEQDVTVTTEEGVDFVTLTEDVFTYASPWWSTSTAWKADTSRAACTPPC